MGDFFIFGIYPKLIFYKFLMKSDMKKLSALLLILCTLYNYSLNAQTNFSEIHGFEPHFVLPPGLDAGKMANIKTDYGAKGDGVTDDTEAFKNAIEGDHPRTLYIPAGTYLINDQLRFGVQASKKKRVLLIGEKRSTTIIRLKDGSSGFGDPSTPKVFLYTRHPSQQGEQNMHHYIQHITLEIGKNNPGAIAMNYHSNNTGSVKDVAIRAVDPENHPGHIGIDISDWGAGPANVRFVEIDGFETGINLKEDNQFTFEHIVLRNCQTGIYTTTASSMRKIKAINCETGIYIKGAAAILDADIQGGSNGDAIIVENENVMIKNLVTSGYSKAINTTTSAGDGDQNGPNVSHWVGKDVTHLWDPDAGKDVTLGLYVEESPEYQYAQSSSEWAVASDAGEVQSAIDAGKTHVYIPRDLKLEGDIYLRNNVKHIMFLGESAAYTNNPTYILKDGNSEAVIIELSYGTSHVKHESPRTVVMRHCAMSYQTEPGGYGGKVFSESNTCKEINLTQVKGWFRDLNTERGGKTPTVTVDDASMWVLGQKTEDFATKLKVINGGFLELLGGTYRMNWDQEDFDRTGLDRNNPPPLFEIDNANASFAGFTSWGPNIPFDPVIREKRGSTARNLARSGGNGAQALYVGYTEVPDKPVTINEAILSNISIYPNPVSQNLILELPETQEPYFIKLYDVSGKTMLSKKKFSGKQSIDISGIAKGVYVLECSSGISKKRHKVVIH